MKPNNAGKGMWLRAQTANQKSKQNVETQDADGMQALSVLYMTQLKAISKQLYISWEEGHRALGPHVSTEAPATRQATLQNKSCLTSPVALTLF